MNHIVKKLSILLFFSIISITAYAQKEGVMNKDQNKIVTISAKSYETETESGVVLVDYWATWCAPCRKMEPILKQIAAETSVKVGKMNVDDYRAFVKKKNINTVPTMIIYKNGVEVERLAGAHSKEEILEILQPHL